MVCGHPRGEPASKSSVNQKGLFSHPKLCTAGATPPVDCSATTNHAMALDSSGIGRAKGSRAGYIWASYVHVSPVRPTYISTWGRGLPRGRLALVLRSFAKPYVHVLPILPTYMNTSPATLRLLSMSRSKRCNHRGLSGVAPMRPT